MFSQALENFEEGIASARSFIRASDAAKALSACDPMGLPSEVADGISNLKELSLGSVSWRVLDHCSAVSRAYALYEQMCERLLSDWLEGMVDGVVWQDLPEGMADAYRAGLSDLLRMIEHDRFEHLTLSAVISNYDKALRGEQFEITPEVLTFHQRNLRMQELNELLVRVGIRSLQAWIDGSAALKSFLGEKSRTYDLVESRLSDFVKYRNDAAHGMTKVDSILGAEQLEDEFDFLLEFCRSLYELVSYVWIESRVERGLAQSFGKNTKNYQGNVAIPSCEAVALKVGEVIAVRGPSYCRFTEIIGIQLDDVAHDEIVVAQPKLVGLKLSEPIPLRGELFQLALP